MSATTSESAFVRLEDAQRDAKECAAILAAYFQGAAFEAGKDDVAMFAAMGHETLARDILKHLDAMLHAAKELVHQPDTKGGAR